MVNEGRALTYLRFRPNRPAVALYDFFGNRQADAGAVLVLVETAEHLENLVGKLHLESAAVIGHLEQAPDRGIIDALDMNFRRHVAPTVSNGIADEVLKKLGQNLVGLNLGSSSKVTLALLSTICECRLWTTSSSVSLTSHSSHFCTPEPSRE